MPTYSYKCSKCDESASETLSIQEVAITPSCSKCDIPMNRVFGVASIQFKGSGWGRDKN